MTPTHGAPATSRWRRDERTLWRSGPGASVVVLSAHDRVPRSLEGTAAVLWAALETARRPSELAARLAREFDADQDVVRSDVDAVVAQLAEAGLLRELP